MILVDDHCHLQHALYKDQLDAVIERAKAAGVKAIICSGVNPPTNGEALEIAKNYPMVRASLGIYPIDAVGLAEEGGGLTRHGGTIDLDEEFKFMRAHKDDIAAIGEVGLDYHWIKDESVHKQMRENFARIIEFVEKLGKPMIVHTRKAELDCIDMLTSSKIKNVVLHCFEGRKHLIQRAADAGFIFSIPTNIVRSQLFQQMAEMASINQITTETDGPYLSPTTGTVNEPANVIEIVKKIAEIKKFTVEETANNIWLNFQRIYG